MSDLDTIKALVLENENLKYEVQARNALLLTILPLLDSKVTLKTADVSANFGQAPDISQTKTLTKLRIPDPQEPT